MRSEETRNKIAVFRTGKPHSDEVKAKISAALKGRKASPSARANMSAAKVGKPMSAAVKAKISAALKARNGKV